jgi:transposase
VVQVQIRESKVFKDAQGVFVESAHGDGDAQATGEARGFVDRARELASAPGHPFYQRLNELLEAEGFDEFVESRCAKFYAARYGRPSLTPGIYFRALLIGYFEGIGAERGIAWRLADSLALRRFVGIGLDEYTPDQSTISRTRRLIDLDTHHEVFGWVLGVLADRGLVQGQRIAIDATTLEANAAMRSIVRRDTGESYDDFLRGLAKASGVETPTREDLVRLDRKRKKRTSNKDRKSPADEDARVTKMKMVAPTWRTRPSTRSIWTPVPWWQSRCKRRTRATRQRSTRRCAKPVWRWPS